MNIIVFGDSIAWGAFDTEMGGWVDRLKMDLFKYEFFVYNCSVSGHTTKDILERMDNEALSRQDSETGIIIAIGANDAGWLHRGSSGVLQVPLVTFYYNIDAILKCAKKITKNICFVGLTPVNDKLTDPVPWDCDLSYFDKHAERYNRAVKELCDKNGILFVDVHKKLNKKSFPDGIHLDPASHKKIFELVKNKIKNWYK